MQDSTDQTYKSILKTNRIVNSALLLTVAGSRLYRTESEDSDSDYKMIYFVPHSFLLTCGTKEEKESLLFDGKWEGILKYPFLNGSDSRAYELDSFLYSVYKSDPNAIEVLFTPESDIIQRNSEYRLDILMKNRQQLITKELAIRLNNWSNAQFEYLKSRLEYLKKIEDPSWNSDLLNNPISEGNLKLLLDYIWGNIKDSIPENLRELKDYLSGLPTNPVETLENLEVLSKLTDINLTLLQELKKAKEYLIDKKRYKSYLKWSTTSSKRKELEVKFGYDCKAAYHSVRLKTMAVECLQGHFILDRKEAGDRQLLLDIKQGKHKLEEIEEIITFLNIKVQEGLRSTKIPDKNNPTIFW